MATIGENIKRSRTKQGLNQDDLARKAELKYSTLAKIAKVLGVSIEELVK